MQALLSLLILLLSAASIALTRSALTTVYDIPDIGSGSSTSHLESGFYDDPANYPLALALLLAAVVTGLTAVIAVFLVGIGQGRGAKAWGLIVANAFWALAWLGLFGYGCYWFHDYAASGCVGSNDHFCRVGNTAFAAFLLVPLVL